MASRLLYGRLCIIIAVIILLFLPLSFTGNKNALAQSPPNLGEEMVRRAYESAVQGYTACLSVEPPHPVNCVAPTPPQPIQPLDCNQLSTCPISGCDPTRTSCPELSRRIECAEGSHSTSQGICVPNLECPAGQRLNFPALTCEPVCPPGQIPTLLDDRVAGCEEPHSWEHMIEVIGEGVHGGWEFFEVFEHFKIGPLPPIFPEDVLCPFSDSGCRQQEG